MHLPRWRRELLAQQINALHSCDLFEDVQRHLLQDGVVVRSKRIKNLILNFQNVITDLVDKVKNYRYLFSKSKTDCGTSSASVSLF